MLSKDHELFIDESAYDGNGTSISAMAIEGVVDVNLTTNRRVCKSLACASNNNVSRMAMQVGANGGIVQKQLQPMYVVITN